VTQRTTTCSGAATCDAPWTGLLRVTSHTFPKTVAMRLDHARLSAGQIADHLGHSRPSLTQDISWPRHHQPPHRSKTPPGL
jgi:integrase